MYWEMETGKLPYQQEAELSRTLQTHSWLAIANISTAAAVLVCGFRNTGQPNWQQTAYYLIYGVMHIIVSIYQVVEISNIVF